jgi:co-chaperonin GroES (HSP10)
VLNANEGLTNFASDAGNAGAELTVNVAANVNFKVSQQLAGLSVSSGGLAAIDAGGTRIVKTSSLGVTGTGKLDVRDNKLAVVAGDIGTWNGSSYTGITGLIASGRGDGSWNGNGIVTTMSDATTSLRTTLAIALAEETPHAGGTFMGVSVNAGDVLVMYTWGGDADLNGELNGDDYFFIDSNVLAQVPGYHNGDFNYDGGIDGDDYFIIDSNITFAQSSPPFPTGVGAGGLAVVPEPAAGVVLATAAAALLQRLRSRRAR